MQARQQLAHGVLHEGMSVSAAARQAGVSRPTARLWVQRAQQQGVAALQEQSRRPHHLRAETAPEVQAQVLALKAAHPAWGAKKLHAVLWPAPASAPVCVRTVDRLLARHGLVTPRAAPPPTVGRFERASCNELWQLDFKGLEATWGYWPLSVIDDHSRYCLGLVPLAHRDTDTVWAALWQLFGDYGLPQCCLCDNGDGFNSRASLGPTRFQAWLWRLGIRTCHGRPRHPQTQGKVERFHRTLETEWAAELRQGSVAQARQVWAGVQQSYNWERPHEAIGQRVPGAVYHASPRPRPARLPEPLVGSGAVRKVDSSGKFSYRNRSYRAGRGLAGEWIEIRATASGDTLYYTNVEIAHLEDLGV